MQNLPTSKVKTFLYDRDSFILQFFALFEEGYAEEEEECTGTIPQ